MAGITRTATELEAHIAAEYSVVFVGGVLAAGLAAGMLLRRRRSSIRYESLPKQSAAARPTTSPPRGDFDATRLGGLILALASAWLGLILLVNGLEAYRGWLVANFVHPPALTRLLLLAPVAIGLAVVSLLASRWAVWLHAWQRACGDTIARRKMLWIAIVLGLLAGLGVTLPGTRVRVVELLALLASFGAGLVASLGRVSGAPRPGGRAPLSAASERLGRGGERAVAVTALVLWLGWTAGSAYRVLPGSRPRIAPDLAGRQPRSDLQTLVRLWHPDAVFVSLAGSRLDPYAIPAREADLVGPRASLVVITDTSAEEALSTEAATRLVRRGARALLRGGCLLVDSESLRVLAAAMECAPTDDRGARVAYVWELRSSAGTQRALVVGPAVPDWLSTRLLPEGTSTQLHCVDDAATAKRLLERRRPVG